MYFFEGILLTFSPRMIVIEVVLNVPTVRMASITVMLIPQRFELLFGVGIPKCFLMRIL
jgi:hypothetical protein